jgi:RNA polymerase sigma factor (sigma-70 family)
MINDGGGRFRMSHNLDENERLLVARCKAGDRQAWDDFFGAHYRTISSVVSWRKWHFSPEEQEDVTQDVVAEVIKSMKHFGLACMVSTFVYKISVNTCVTHLRYKTALKRKTSLCQVPLDPVGNGDQAGAMQVAAPQDSNPEALLLSREKTSLIRKALAALEARCKELVTLRYLLEYSIAEIAEKIGVKQNTLVVQLKRCLLRLHKAVQEVI